MDSVQLITDEWIDIIYISGENSVRRKNNGDTGKIKKYIYKNIIVRFCVFLNCAFLCIFKF